MKFGIQTVLAAAVFAALALGCTDDEQTRAPAAERGASALANATCAEGAEQPAEDGCNTCNCVGGEWQCSELACVGEDQGGEPSTSPPANEGDGDCDSGEDSDCHEPVSSEDLPACADGDAMPAADGCNTCECLAGAWACTELACGE